MPAAATTLPVDANAPAVARRWLADVAGGWALDRSLCTDGMLLLSELVTNVFEHASETPRVHVQILWHWPTLSVAVTDASPVHPVIREPAPSEFRGYGMQLIAGLARRWGSEPYPGGKRVWVELAAPDAPPWTLEPSAIDETLERILRDNG
ncbi:ATP-binding protein [Pseudonocardia eucalypti]|uniref:ATP-binding protein n=1 Tax=Pseudonocardia eucalypti TaxID=648755 RepID=A0ABP9Q8G0_9PSEU|nr:anti-sigma regulatory factor (Ser/Thr protein kinase) [Pseudonocardia eucalypti]